MSNINCDACRACYVCRACYACDACEQVKNSMFCKDIECSKNMLFNKQVSKDRVYEVKRKWIKLRDEWLPMQTIGWEESWKNIPTKLLEYIKSLTEFDAELFKEITSIDVNLELEVITDEDMADTDYEFNYN